MSLPSRIKAHAANLRSNLPKRPTGVAGYTADRRKGSRHRNHSSPQGGASEQKLKRRPPEKPKETARATGDIVSSPFD
jgi:hypothetical protein